MACHTSAGLAADLARLCIAPGDIVMAYFDWDAPQEDVTADDGIADETPGRAEAERSIAIIAPLFARVNRRI